MAALSSCCFGVSGLGGGLDGCRRLAVQGLAQRPLDDRRHLAPKIELVPPGIDRRHALAGVREQRADLFERVARPVEDRCGGPPKVVRRPALHPEPGNDLLRRLVEVVVRGRSKSGAAGSALRCGRSSSSAKPESGVMNALPAFIRSAGSDQCGPCTLGPRRSRSSEPTMPRTMPGRAAVTRIRRSAVAASG